MACEWNDTAPHTTHGVGGGGGEAAGRGVGLVFQSRPSQHCHLYKESVTTLRHSLLRAAERPLSGDEKDAEEEEAPSRFVGCCCWRSSHENDDDDKSAEQVE